MKIVEHVAATKMQEWAERIYAEYPRKSGKGAAIKAILKVLKDGSVKPEWLLEKVMRYAIARSNRDPEFTRKCENWMRDQNYLDPESEWCRMGMIKPEIPTSGFPQPKGKVGMSAEERRLKRNKAA
jgi:hypothetical protein